jgi:hypothetical protein
MTPSPLQCYHWATSVLAISLEAPHQLYSFLCFVPLCASPTVGGSTVFNLSLNINVNIGLLGKTR